ncbi:phage major capsid protein, HK97 family [Nitrosospira multiformis]|uniref:Phage major capsid protein, HK97 family n=1 Tax=Nitrosospira multiformis TaxID=1231 RepID=A0A1H8Q2U9_9PROT|nr:phage major capsid protein [Nitrosospira multiformis]SEO48406.1 phage major capsid protein, HK97 family [Nitrosospira multiformis]
MSYESINGALVGIESELKSFTDRAEKRIEALSRKQRELSDELLEVRQRQSAPGPEASGLSGHKSIGAQVWAGMESNRDLLAKTKSLRLEIKAAADLITTDNVGKVVSGGLALPLGAALGIQTGLPAREVSGITSFEYSRYTGVQGAAAVQAGEGGAKAPIRPDFTPVQQAAITIAGFTKVSKQSLSDSAELKTAIDVTLQRSIAQALDDTLVNGSATPAFEGFNTLGTSYTSLLYPSLADAASEAVATMQEAGFQPNVVAFRPSDFLGVQLAKTTEGEYLAGPYLQPLPESLRGLRVVLSPNVPSGKVMVADTAYLELLVVDNFSVEVGYVNDDFTKNIATILGEVRVIPTFRAVGAARVITPKAAA